MKTVMTLVNRNIKIYMRDKAAVFFSLLSMLITLLLMILFLGSMNSDAIMNLLLEYGGERDPVKDRLHAEHLVRVWTLAGIVLVNCVTVTMTVMENLIQDEAQGRLCAFYAAPVSRVRIMLGYLLSAWSVGTGMSLLTLLLGNLYLGMNGKALGLQTCLILTGMIWINSFFYASLAYLLTLFVHSSSAWGGLLSVTGTLVGFLGGHLSAHDDAAAKGGNGTQDTSGIARCFHDAAGECAGGAFGYVCGTAGTGGRRVQRGDGNYRFRERGNPFGYHTDSPGGLFGYRDDGHCRPDQLET